MNTTGGGFVRVFDFSPPIALSPPKTRKSPPENNKKPFCPCKMRSYPAKTPQLRPKCPYLALFCWTQQHGCSKIARKTKKRYTNMVSVLKALEHICKLEEMLLNDGVTPSCIYMNACTHSLLGLPDTVIGYPVVVDNAYGDDIVCLRG